MGKAKLSKRRITSVTLLYKTKLQTLFLLQLPSTTPLVLLHYLKNRHLTSARLGSTCLALMFQKICRVSPSYTLQFVKISVTEEEFIVDFIMGSTIVRDIKSSLYNTI